MRPARALINLEALRHNYRFAKQAHGARVFAVIKANAYGHGAVQCAQALSGEADGFAVAILEEALELRAAGIALPILVLEGIFEQTELDLVSRHDLWTVVHHAEQLRMIECSTISQPLTIWLKMNSGMNRAGFAGDQLQAAWQRLHDSGKVGDIALITHLARADETGSDATSIQLDSFDTITRKIPGIRSISNSAGILGWPASHRDWGRAGIMLYGSDPVPDRTTRLRPVMTLQSSIFAVRDIPVGAPLGYGARFHAERPTRVGLVAMGYADGYPRCLADGTPVVVDGIRTRLIGRISMDMLTVDLTDLPQSGLGSQVELWGSQLPVSHIAQAANTISYELLCNVKRVAFEYLDQEADQDHLRR